MSIILKFLKIIFKSELNHIYSDQIQINKIFNKFNISFFAFNFFLKSLIIFYIFFAFFLNIIFILIFFFKFKLNFFYNVNIFLKKVPFLKNIQNFLIANLLLHTN